MKHVRFLSIIMLSAALAFTACGGDGGGDDGSAPNPFDTADTPGDTVSVTAGDVGFDMIYANNQASITIPTGTADDGTDEITTKFFMGETEVTWELWKEVYDWAVHDDRGADVYAFQNTGRMGSVDGGVGMTDQHPVTMVSWRDAVIWCNALSEMTGAEVVYLDKGTGDELRSSEDEAYGPGVNVEDVVTSDGVNLTRKGYRLPTSMEWEMAARYRGSDSTNTVSGFVNPYYTKGNSASGDTQYYNGSTVGDYAWYDGNTSTTQPVSASDLINGKTPNELGLYDMSGNVWEWCFTKDVSKRVRRGGSWDVFALSLRMGYVSSFIPDHCGGNVGFRFARTQ